jgi:dihydroorotate dehydrogenase electron transfer subunit
MLRQIMKKCKHKSIKQMEATLIRRDSHLDLYHLLMFEIEKPMEAQPGQFIMVRSSKWKDDPFLSRPMSLLSAGKRPSILIKVVGKGTQDMSRVMAGDKFKILGPLGCPWPDCLENHTPILIAGGVGISPLMFLTKSLIHEGKHPVIILGGKSVSDLPLERDLLHLNIDHVIVTEDGSYGYKGLATDILVDVLLKTSERNEKIYIYACGPKAMLARVNEMANKVQAPCSVSLESVMGCGHGICLGCAIPKAKGGFFYTCKDGPCVDGNLIDWERYL